VPATFNLTQPDEACTGLNCVALRAVRHDLRRALNNSFGFGGTNASLLFSRYEAPADESE
jgi:3-oxoacyl-[acyl-carrier-protein] synthase II